MAKIDKEVLIKNPQGLHARPAAVFVQIASKYNAQLKVSKEGCETIDGKSIMGILTLGAHQNSMITLHADGDDATAMILELEELLSKETMEHE